MDFPLNVLVTVMSVNTTQNLRSCTVWISVTPDHQRGHIMEMLEKNIYTLQGLLNKSLRTRPLPRMRFKASTPLMPSN